MTKEKRFSQEARIGDFKLGKTIGQGAFSKVKVGYHKDTGQKVAIKIIEKKIMIEKVARSVKRKHKLQIDQAKKAAEAASAKALSIKSTDLPSNQPPAEDSAAPSLLSEIPVPTPVESIVGLEVAEDDNDVPCISPISNPVGGIGQDSKSLMDSLYAEVKLMMRLDHPNIIGLYQVIDTKDECFIIMEYAAGGEMIDYIAAKDHLPEKEARRFFRQIISAIQQCHQANVVHRDLKLDNLLLSKTRDVLITDFGLGRTFRSDIDDLMMTFCGTPNYAAVELISFKPYIGVKADIWAIGVILFIMCSGRPPFSASSIPSLYSKIMNVQYKCPDHFSSGLKTLLSKILIKNPEDRATMNTLFTDPWVNFEEVERPLRLPPLYNSLRENGMEQIISINNAADHNVVIFQRYQTDFLGEAAQENNSSTISGPLSLVRRMSFSYNNSSNSRNNASPNPSMDQDHTGENDEGGGLKMSKSASARKDLDSGMSRRLSMTMQRRASTARARSTSPNSATSAIRHGAGGSFKTDIEDVHAPAAAITRFSRRTPMIEDIITITSVPSNEIHRSPTDTTGGTTLLASISEFGANNGAQSAQQQLDPMASNVNRMRFLSLQEGDAQPMLRLLPSALKTGRGIQGAAMSEEVDADHTIDPMQPRHLDPFNSRMQRLPEPLSPIFGTMHDDLGDHDNRNEGHNFPPLSPERAYSPSSQFMLSLNRVTINESGNKGGTERRRSMVPTGDSILYNLRNSGVSPDLPPEELQIPSTQAINDFHALHRPAKVIRSLRFSFTLATTSSKPVGAIFQDIHRVLLLQQQQFQTLRFERDRDLYLFTCTIGPQVTMSLSPRLLGSSPTEATIRAGSPTLPMITVPEAENEDNNDTLSPKDSILTTVGASGGQAETVTPVTASPVPTGVAGDTIPLVFEMEVCKIWLLRMNGVRIKRIAGDPLVFKDMYRDIVSKMNI